MIAPLPQSSLAPLETPAAKARPEAKDGFPGILNAADRTSRLQGPPPAPEHGPLIVKIDVGREAEISLPAPQSDDTLSASAEVFNQEGFFGDVVASPDASQHLATAAEEPQPVAPEAEAARSQHALSAPQIADGQLPQIVAPQSRADAAQTVSANAMHASYRSLASPAATVSAPIPSRAGAAHAEGEGRSEAARPLARRAAFAMPAAGSVVQVVLHELERGLHISARADALDEGERLRLHDEIAALLASHGLSARSVRIHAPVRSALLQEKFK